MSNDPSTHRPMVEDAVQTSTRGLYAYGGQHPLQLRDVAGTLVEVSESSNADHPEAYLAFTRPGLNGREDSRTVFIAPLDLAEAMAIRDRLDQFVQGTLVRWEDGPEHYMHALEQLQGRAPRDPARRPAEGRVLRIDNT